MRHKKNDNKINTNANIKKTIRKLVWNHYIGQKYGQSRCWCCNSTTITPFEFECGHVLAKSKGGLDTIKNLRPICSLCNKSMGNQHMMEFQKEHGLPKKLSWYEYFFK